MNQRTGRPTDNPKRGRLEIRTSEEEDKMLEYCCKQTGKTKADIIRAGIREIYNKLKNSGD